MRPSSGDQLHGRPSLKNFTATGYEVAEILYCFFNRVNLYSESLEGISVLLLYVRIHNSVTT